jgi:hypothetical protein
MSKLASVVCVAAALLVLPAGAVAKRKPPPPPPPPTAPPPSSSSTYVRTDANLINGVQYDVTPEDVQATSDGGSIDLGLTASPNGSHPGVSWLLKGDGFGTAQWQEEVGCLGTPPGAYADAVSVTTTSDGGYVLAGGTIGCGSGTNCPELSGIQCALVERLDATGRLEWAGVYSAGVDGTVFNQVAATAGGGFVAVGSATDANHDIGALIVKLDALGNVQWETELGPGSTTQAQFEAVQPASDGGFLATGEFFTPSANTPMNLLVAKFDGSGGLSWQRGLAGTKADGTPSNERGFSAVQTAAGGFAVAGSWSNTTSPGTCCSGPLLIQLDASGSVQWQRAYNGGVRCFDNGLSCESIGGVAYSLRQTADGGYLLAGESPVELGNEAPEGPWLAKTDGNGSLVWQESDYEVTVTGGPLSEYFAAAAITPAGYLAAGATENPANGLGELLSVQTDPAGAVGTCSQIHQVSTLAPIDPSLATVAPGLPVSKPAVSVSPSPAQILATSTAASSGQC